MEYNFRYIWCEQYHYYEPEKYGTKTEKLSNNGTYCRFLTDTPKEFIAELQLDEYDIWDINKLGPTDYSSGFYP